MFLFEKAKAIAQTITNTREAMSLAIKTLPPPWGEAKAAQYAAMGALNVAIIGATAISGFNQGGFVGGGFGGGDRVPAMLEAGELVVPKSVAPTFLDVVAENQYNSGSGASGQTSVIIGFEEDAARYITVKQREDRALGVAR